MLLHLKTGNWREKNQLKAWAYLPQEGTTWNWQNFNICHRSFANRHFHKYLCRTGQDLLAIWGRCPAVYVAKEQPQSERRSLVFFSFCIVSYILSKPVKSDFKRKCEFSDYPIVKMLQNSPSSIEKVAPGLDQRQRWRGRPAGRPPPSPPVPLQLPQAASPNCLPLKPPAAKVPRPHQDQPRWRWARDWRNRWHKAPIDSPLQGHVVLVLEPGQDLLEVLFLGNHGESVRPKLERVKPAIVGGPQVWRALLPCGCSCHTPIGG